MKLKYDVYGYTARHHERAKSDYKKGEKRSAKKALLNGKRISYTMLRVSALRATLLAIQIAKGETVLSYEEFRKYHYEIIDRDCTYEEMLEWYA